VVCWCIKFTPLHRAEDQLPYKIKQNVATACKTIVIKYLIINVDLVIRYPYMLWHMVNKRSDFIHDEKFRK